MPRSLRPLLLLAAVAFAGCAPSLKVNVLEPARVNLGASKQLTIVQSEGRRSAREYVIAEVLKQARQDGYFQATDRTEDGMTVKLAGRQVEVQGAKGAPQGAEEIGLRIDVLDWNANKDTKQEETTDSKGNKKTTEKRIYVGKVVLGVTAFNAQGKALLAEKEYEARAEGEDEGQALNAAGAQAVDNLLGDITPRYVTRFIRMDDEDDAQKQIIKVAEKGNVPQALKEMQAYTEKNPDSAGAHYNLAVLLDATGEYEKALEHYSRAISVSSKDYYVKMKGECAQRLANQQALSE